MALKVRLYGQHFVSTCLAPLLYCKLKPSFGRITTLVTNWSPGKYSVASLKNSVCITDQSFVIEDGSFFYII